MTESDHCDIVFDESPSNRHISFVLRCWTNVAGEVRARLIDVRSGISYPVAQLDDLSTLVRDLVVMEGKNG